MPKRKQSSRTQKLRLAERNSAIEMFREDSPPYHVNGNGGNGRLKETLPLWRRPSKDKPRILDLFCCAGGVAVGYSRAGFDIVGVDIDPQPHFPFEFIQADALTLDMKFLRSFDAIHASPPCQSYSDLAKRNRNAHEWPRLIEPVREILIKSGKPYVIENVEGAPLLNPVVLCGTMFKGLRVLRQQHSNYNENIQNN
jgi:DNA (cytosine-5)-methyltransferase 1